MFSVPLNSSGYLSLDNGNSVCTLHYNIMCEWSKYWTPGLIIVQYKLLMYRPRLWLKCRPTPGDWYVIQIVLPVQSWLTLLKWGWAVSSLVQHSIWWYQSMITCNFIVCWYGVQTTKIYKRFYCKNYVYVISVVQVSFWYLIRESQPWILFGHVCFISLFCKLDN